MTLCIVRGPAVLAPDDPGYLGATKTYRVGSKRDNERMLAALMREPRWPALSDATKRPRPALASRPAVVLR